MPRFLTAVALLALGYATQKYLLLCIVMAFIVVFL
jgi:hypothetical protein